MEIERKSRRTWQQSVLWPRFEPGTCRIRNRSANSSTAVFCQKPLQSLGGGGAVIVSWTPPDRHYNNYSIFLFFNFCKFVLGLLFRLKCCKRRNSNFVTTGFDYITVLELLIFWGTMSHFLGYRMPDLSSNGKLPEKLFFSVTDFYLPMSLLCSNLEFWKIINFHKNLLRLAYRINVNIFSTTDHVGPEVEKITISLTPSLDGGLQPEPRETYDIQRTIS